jgi:hypothetical protein
VRGSSVGSHRGQPPEFRRVLSASRELLRACKDRGRATVRPRPQRRTLTTMFAQLIEARLGRKRLVMLEHIVRRELIPALREESGFCGAVNLTDRARAETLLVLLWETEEQASRPLVPGTAPFANAFSTVSELLASDSCVVTIWEVDARG